MYPPLEELRKRRSGFQYITSTGAGATQVLVSTSPTRVGLFVGYAGGAGNQLKIGPGVKPTAGGGMELSDGMSWVYFTIEMHGTIVQHEWTFTENSLAGNAILVIETFQD